MSKRLESAAEERGGNSPSDVRERKKQLRREMKALREALPAAWFRDAGERMQRQLFSLPDWPAAKRVFVYVSMEREPDTRMILRRALAEGKSLYVPKCLGGGRMLAVRIRSLEELSPGVLGIPEPESWTETCEAADLDLMIVPCVCASRDGRRLGHGGGYYDRFLAGHADKAVCLCFRDMLREDLPAEETDVRVPRVLTEEGLCGATGG